MRRPGSLASGHAPESLEHLPRRIVGHVPIAGELVRERAHVAGALHVVLPAQRVHADAGLADIAGRHGEVRHAHHHGRALAVLGDAKPVIDRTLAARRVEPRRAAHVGGGNADHVLDGFGRMTLVGDEARPALESVEIAALAHVFLVDQTLGHDHVREGVDHRDVRAGQQGQMIIGLDVRRSHEVDAARVDDDEPGTLAQPPLHARGEDRMPIGRVRADHHR